MDPISIGLLGIIALLVVIFFTRLPVGFAMAIIGFLGFARILNLQAARGMIGTEVWNVFSSYGLTVIPLFILMGQICFYSGVNERLYRSANAWLGHVKGGIAMATVLACGGFAANSSGIAAFCAVINNASSYFGKVRFTGQNAIPSMMTCCGVLMRARGQERPAIHPGLRGRGSSGSPLLPHPCHYLQD